MHKYEITPLNSTKNKNKRHINIDTANAFVSGPTTV